MSNDSKSQQVSLGCGTLILIALIVMIFTNRGGDDLEREIQSLRGEIGELKQTVENQTDEIENLQDEVEALNRRE